jgi:hypothetical protein
MSDMRNIDKHSLTLTTLNAVRRLLQYAFRDINWSYDGLTDVEKATVTREEFELVVHQFNLRDL